MAPNELDTTPVTEAPTRSRPTRHPALLRIGIIVGAAAPVLALVLYVVRSMEPSATAAITPPRDVPVLDGNVIRFSDSFAKRSGLETIIVASRLLSPVVKLTGTVNYDTRKFAAVGARIAGRVRRVFKVVGDQVRAHEVLAELESAELGRAESLVSAARAREMAAEADLKRERRLADAKITPERDAEIATATYEAARSERRAAEHAVEALGGDLIGDIGILQLKSPFAGKVVTSKISRGQSVQPTDTAYEIADLSSLWVELRLFEADLAAVRAGDTVEISSATNPNLIVKGTVGHVGDVVDVETRSAPIRVVINNRDGSLRPGQSVHARIHTSASAGALPTVPRTAVTRIDGQPTVFVLVDNSTVEPRKIKLGSEDANDVAVIDGLGAGERVVRGGMFALKSEIFR